MAKTSRHSQTVPMPPCIAPSTTGVLHPDIGTIAPAEFIPIAEESGQSLPSGEWAMRSAVQQMKAWVDGGLAPMAMAVNLSAVQIRHPHLPDRVSQILAAIGLPPQYLQLE